LPLLSSRLTSGFTHLNQLDYLLGGGALLSPGSSVTGRWCDDPHAPAFQSELRSEPGGPELTGRPLIRHDDDVLYMVSAAELGDELCAVCATRPTNDRKAQVEQCRSIRLTFGNKQTRFSAKFGGDEQSRPTAGNAEFSAITSSKPDTDRRADRVLHRERISLVIPRPSRA